MKKPISRIQHYVPQFILKRFSQNEQICTFDKWTEKTFCTNIKNVCAEKDFYNIQFDDTIASIEPSLSNLETQAATVIDKLIKSQNIKVLSKEDKYVLAVFLTAQLFRSKSHRERLIHTSKEFAEALRKRGCEPDKVEGYKELNDHDAKRMSMRLMQEMGDFYPHFLDKDWILYKPNAKETLYISDNPLTFQNNNDYGWCGNIGLAVKGIEMYFPLTPKLSLGIFCKSIMKQIGETLFKVNLAPIYSPTLLTAKQNLEAIYKPFRAGDPLLLNTQNVVNQNSLQVKYSERFVFSYTNDFKVVKQMLSKYPKCKNGIRPKVR
jgi:hypothetical protein